MDWLIFAGTIALGYLIGSVPFGYLIGRAKGVDIRKCGSCNIGATNVSRCVGVWYGRGCFLLDFLKGLLPVLVLMHFFPHGSKLEYLPLAGGLSTILGHMFCAFFKFRGGKGISTAAGVVMAMTPYALLLALAVWVAVFLKSRYVSLASIVAAATLPLAATGWYFTGLAPRSLGGELGFFYLIAAAAIIKHRSNIRRLFDGTENRFAAGKKE